MNKKICFLILASLGWAGFQFPCHADSALGSSEIQKLRQISSAVLHSRLNDKKSREKSLEPLRQELVKTQAILKNVLASRYQISASPPQPNAKKAAATSKGQAVVTSGKSPVEKKVTPFGNIDDVLASFNRLKTRLSDSVVSTQASTGGGSRVKLTYRPVYQMVDAAGTKFLSMKKTGSLDYTLIEDISRKFELVRRDLADDPDPSPTIQVRTRHRD